VTDENGASPPHPSSGRARAGADWPALWFAQDIAARLVVARDLGVLALNHRAADLLETNGVLGLRDGQLSAKDRRSNGDLSAAVAGAGAAPCVCAVGPKEAVSVLVEAVALEADGQGAVGLVLRDLATPIEIECADLEPMFGVTPGEQLVVVQLLKGRSSRDIADATGKSVLTVRTHVKRAYGKIGVKTRGQLFARLLPYLSIRWS
jgi:DNA-binding CsgD family transcriptional regulator